VDREIQFQQITDACLRAFAVFHDGRRVTFDQCCKRTVLACCGRWDDQPDEISSALSK
jgi:hypothetical protein